MVNKLDELLAKLGTGWWNVLHYVAMGYCMGLPVSQALSGAFMVPKVDYTCIPSIPATSATSFNDDISNVFDSEDTASTQVYLNNSHKSQCTYHIENSETGDFKEHLCTDWHFDNSTFTTTITSDFELICDRNYLRATYTGIYMSGVFVGGLLSAFLADKYGRKRMIMSALIPFTCLGLVSCWITNLSALLFCRFMMGAVNPFILTTCYIMVVEITEARLRPHMGILGALPWAFGVVFWGGVAYLIRSWRWLQFAVSIPGVFVIPLLWFTDESPRWLAVAGYHDRALQVLKKAATWNKATLPPDNEVMEILKESQDNEDSSKSKHKNREFKEIMKDNIKSTTILFRTPKLRKITFIVYVDYLIVNLVYYGLTLSGGTLSENPYVYMVLSGVMEVPAYSLPVPLVSRFGRRIPGVISYLLSGITLLALAPIPSGHEWLIMSMAMVGKVTVSVAYQITAFYSTELFPTEVRSRGMGTSFMVSQIGAILAPFITEILGSAFPWAPSVVFGATSIVASIATLTLPETLGVALPDTVADLEERSEQVNTRSWMAVPTSEKSITT